MPDNDDIVDRIKATTKSCTVNHRDRQIRARKQLIQAPLTYRRRRRVRRHRLILPRNEGEEEDDGRRALHRREDSSRRRAVLPRTSHPWFPPALEPLNHSVVQRFDGPAVLNRPILPL